MALLLMAAPRAAPAEDLGIRLSMGAGGASRGLGGQWRAALPVELTLTLVPLVSLSAGMVASEAGIDHAYGEFGLYLVASLGAGVGYGASDRMGTRASGTTAHLFAGIPIPLVADRRLDTVLATQRFLYLLPYYRPSWGPWPGALHEFGLMAKFGLPLKPIR